jgi:hypothetical protein
MDRPQELVDYRNFVIEKNKLEAKIKKLRPRVGELLEESGGYDDLYLMKVEKIEYHEDVIYDWLTKEYPDIVSDVSKITVDIDKFGELIKKGIIAASDVPEHCVSWNVQWHVKTTPKAKEVLNDSTG